MLDTTMDSGVSISIDRLYDRLIRIGLQKNATQFLCPLGLDI